MAIKTVIFSGVDQNTALVASEAAIASNLSHENVVSTYSHDIVDIQKANGPELGIYKFYLIQVIFYCVLMSIYIIIFFAYAVSYA